MSKKIIPLALLILSSPAWAEATSSLTTGFDYTTGKYGGSTSTNILYVPVTGKYQTDDWFVKLTVPYISMSSDGSGVVRGSGKIKATTPTSSTTTQSGLGDVVASAGFTVLEKDALLLDLVGNIKFGTADESKNLGTGANDYSAQLDGFYTLRKTTLFATAGYKIVGAPEGATVNNIAYGTLGASQKISEKTSAGAMLDVAQSSSVFNDGTREVSVFVAQKISQTLKVQASVLRGLSDSSPDFGGSLMVTGSF